MGWKEYLAQRCRKYTFEEIGLPEFYVKLRGLESFPHGESLKMAEEMRNMSDEEATRASHELLKKMIVEWNFTDPETDEPLPLPREDIEALLKLPNEIIIKINEWVGERMNPENVVPPQSGA